MPLSNERYAHLMAAGKNTRFKVGDGFKGEKRLVQSYIAGTKLRMTEEQYDELWIEQLGLCAMCKREPERQLAVDHNHATQQIRGLLCTSCNTGLGSYEKLKDVCSDYLKGVSYAD
jgi:hypothetical protein